MPQIYNKLRNIVGAAWYNTSTSETGYLSLAKGTTAQRPSSPAVGDIRYNTTTGYGELYTSAGWAVIGQSPPSISSVTPVTYNGESGTTFTINGTNFTNDIVVKFISNSNIEYSAGTVAFINSTQVTATTPQDFTVAQEPFDVKVSQASGSYTILDVIDCGGSPTWSTAAGTLATYVYPTNTTYSTSVSATDPDAGATISYSISSGSLPTSASLNTSTGAITGSIPDPGASSVTNTFDITATDNAGNTSTRSFNIIRQWADGSTSARAGTSAASIKSLTGTSADGTYWISLPIVGNTQIYCDMSTDGGGWMMLAYCGNTAVGDSVQTVFDTIGSISSSRAYGQTSFSRFDVARQMSGGSTNSMMMWRRTNDSNVILIHNIGELWNRIPGGSSAGNRDLNGSGSGYPIATMKMSNSGVNGIVTRTTNTGRYESGASYPGIAWNSTYNDNNDNVGSFTTYLNRRSIIYWETNGVQGYGQQWFHGDPLQLGPCRGPFYGRGKLDIEVYFKV